jgi:heme exporter protein A
VGHEEIARALAAAGLAQLDPELPVRSFSAGQRKRVALARLSLWRARLWLLDEPAANLDAAGQAVLGRVLETHLAGGGSVLLATHQPIALDGVPSRTWVAPEAAAA